MAEPVHDARHSWWNGDIITLCGQRFPGGRGWKDKFFAISINCKACKAAAKRKR